MYYFAYGSNMNFEHMRRLCGWHFSVVGAAVLKDFKFSPDARGYVSACAQAGQEIMGVLYEIDQYCLDILDEFEGYPQVYDRIKVKVQDALNRACEAWIYLEPREKISGSVVKEEHMRRVIAGARENHLPEKWIKFLESFKTE